MADNRADNSRGGMGMPMMGMGMMGAMGADFGGEEPAAPKREKKAAPSKRSLFLRAAVPDFLLVLVASVALTMTVTYGFKSAPELRGDVLVVGAITIPMLLILFAGSYTKKAIIPAAAGCIAYAIAVVVALTSLQPEGVEMFVDGVINDVGENYAVFGFVALFVPVAVFLLSRKRLGVFVLLMFAIISCELTQYLFREWVSDEPGLLLFFITMAAIVAMFVFQGYRDALMNAKRVVGTNFKLVLVYALGLAAALAAVGALLFVLVIANLGLTTPDVKPFKDYYQRPTVEYTGIYSEQQVDNPDITTNQTNDNMDESNQDAEGGVSEQSPSDSNDEGANPLTSLIQEFSNYDVDDWNELFHAINYSQLVITLLVILIPIVLAIALVIYLKKRSRKTRLEKMAGECNEYKILALWAFLEERFRRIGITRPASLTPLEYAMASRQALLPFAKGTGGVDFLELTLIYQRVAFGGREASDEEYRAFERFYLAFFKNARSYVGKRRWIIAFWRL